MKLKQNDVFMAKEEKFEEKSLLQPLTTEPTGGTVAESVDGFMPYVEQLILKRSIKNVKKLDYHLLRTIRSWVNMLEQNHKIWVIEIILLMKILKAI